MSTPAPATLVRRVVPSDRQRWTDLYAAYRAFYLLDADDAVVDRVWQWVVGEQHGLVGLVAVPADGADELLGLANLRSFARPAGGSIGLYLDDLFTDPAARRRGVGAALIAAAGELAAQRGASVVRWITDGGNATARALYDQHATATPWVTYDMAPAARA